MAGGLGSRPGGVLSGRAMREAAEIQSSRPTTSHLCTKRVRNPPNPDRQQNPASSNGHSQQTAAAPSTWTPLLQGFNDSTIHVASVIIADAVSSDTRNVKCRSASLPCWIEP